MDIGYLRPKTVRLVKMKNPTLKLTSYNHTSNNALPEVEEIDDEDIRNDTYDDDGIKKLIPSI